MIILSIHISPEHIYFGHHGRPAGAEPMVPVDAVEVVEGRGLRGDRFFGYRPDYKGQVTLLSAEVVAGLRTLFKLPHLTGTELRRNLVVSQVDLQTLIGCRFSVQGVLLEGVEECRPCAWMDRAVAPGAEAWLRGRGGLRCRALSSGWLRPGGAGLKVLQGPEGASGGCRAAEPAGSRFRAPALPGA